MFQMPLLVYYLAKQAIKYTTLARKRRCTLLLAIFVVSAVIPPDVASQMLMAVPMYGL